jgi:hypothetical protein
MTRSCTVHLVLNEQSGESQYFISVFVENEATGRGPFSPQTWPFLSQMFKQWGLDEADVSALKEKLDRNQHAAREIEIKDSDLRMLGVTFKAVARHA